MQPSSETIGTIGSALAKAQAELTNPEKSLVATIRTDGPGGGRNARFAMPRFLVGLKSSAKP